MLDNYLKTHRARLLWCALCLAGLLLAQNGPWYTPPALAQTTLTATQDTFVDPNNPTTAYDGQRLELAYGNFPNLVETRRVLLQFDLNGVTDVLVGAPLVLTGVENNFPPGASLTVGLYALADNWSEATVTFDTLPTVGAQLQTVTVNAGATAAVRFSAAAVGAYLEAQRTGDGLASFLIKIDTGSGTLGFGGNYYFEDREGSADGINGNEPLLDVPAPATITIVLDGRPNQSIDLAFLGDLGTFYLDDAAVDDSDGIPNSRTFSVAPGRYTVQRGNPANWFTTAIACTPETAAVIRLPQRRAVITVASGDNVTCTFTVDRAVVIRNRAFNDMVRNGANLGKRNAADPWIQDWPFVLYSSPNSPLDTGMTTPNPVSGIPETRFLSLLPGAYTVCTEAPAAGWTFTMPAAVDPNYGAYCKSVTLAPGQSALLLFGAYQPAAPALVVAADSPEAVITDEDEIIDLPEEENGIDDGAGEPASQIFLPLINR
jgi:hypothetical protein